MVPRRNWIKENKINIKRMQKSCDDLHKVSAPSPSHNSSASSKHRPNFITTVNPKHSEKLVVATSEQQTNIKPARKPLLGRQKRQMSQECPRHVIETRPSSSMSNFTVRDQSIQTEDDTKEETFLKDTIIRYPSSTNMNNANPSTTNERGSLIGSLKKEGSTHSLGKSVSIKTPSEIDSRIGDMTDDDFSEHLDRKHFSDPKSDAKGRIIKSPVLDARKLKNEKNKRETLLVPASMKTSHKSSKNSLLIFSHYRL